MVRDEAWRYDVQLHVHVPMLHAPRTWAEKRHVAYALS